MEKSGSITIIKKPEVNKGKDEKVGMEMVSELRRLNLQT